MRERPQTPPGRPRVRAVALACLAVVLGASSGVTLWHLRAAADAPAAAEPAGALGTTTSGTPATAPAPTTTTTRAPVAEAGTGEQRAPRTTPPPSGSAKQATAPGRSGFPGAASTGVPAGTRLRSSGPLSVTTEGAVVDGLDVDGCLTISADRVRVRNSRIRCDGGYVVRIADGVRGVVVEDVEIDGLGDPETIAIGVNGFILRRADVHGVGDGPRMGDATVVEDSWIHGLAVGGGSHNDGIQSTGGRGIVIRHNRIDHPGQQTSCILLGADLGDIDGALVEGNLLNGGNYTVYAGADRGHSATRIRIVGNRFGRDFVFGPADIDPGVSFSSNVFDDSGQTIRP